MSNGRGRATGACQTPGKPFPRFEVLSQDLERSLGEPANSRFHDEGNVAVVWTNESRDTNNDEEEKLDTDDDEYALVVKRDNSLSIRFLRFFPFAVVR